MLLGDGAPIKFGMSIAPALKDAKAAVFGQEEEEGDIKKCKVPLVKLDFTVAKGKKAKESAA